ncbi:MAG: hypothetical protein PHY80_01680 [Rickettsiales bacterium]|nr:hypothetical protein [Rickettsiales bacterium]
MIFNDLIQNFYFKIVKDKIATFIANERDNQIQLARDKGYTETKIKSDLDFTIFTDKFKPLTKEDLPCIIIDIANTTYPPNMQYCNKVYANSTLQFYLFSKGYSQQNTDTETNKSTIISDDKISSIRLDYLLSQILAICNSEQSYCFGTENNRNIDKSLYIDKKILNSWKRILTPEDNNQTETTLAYLLEYNISYFEYTEQIKGDELKELYTKLNIRDEFIDPFIKLIIDDE